MTTKPDVQQTESPPAAESLPEYQRKRRQRIIEAAVELLADGEYETIQVRDVAERAGTSLGTLYRYFSSKEHLYAAAMLEWASNFAIPGQRSQPRAQSDEERLRRLMSRTISALERQPQMMRAQMILENSNDPNAKALYRQFGVEHVATLRAALTQMSPEDAVAVVDTALSVMTIGLHSWARGVGTIRDVERSVQRSIDLIFSAPPSR
jgi:TetR/AcrR family transcriptional regulator, cholesterol catabolism regulator